MELATIVVLVITAAFLAFCIWIERHSRSQERAQDSSRSADDHPHVNRRPSSGTGEGTHERKFDKGLLHKRSA